MLKLYIVALEAALIFLVHQYFEKEFIGEL